MTAAQQRAALPAEAQGFWGGARCLLWRHVSRRCLLWTLCAVAGLGAASCATDGPSAITTVRLAVSWDENWGLTRFEVTARDRMGPTNAVKEIEIRLPDERAYPWGSASPTCTRANGPGCTGDTDAVGTRPGGDSAYGAHDMAGNVWEWVSDWYSASYYSSCAGGCTNPTGPTTGTDRVVRGGSWYYDRVSLLRSATRSYDSADNGDSRVGFRCSSDW